MKPILSEAVAKLKAFEEIRIDREEEQKLLRISASTIDRLLKEERKKYELKGRSHTKPGTLLKNQIPQRGVAPLRFEGRSLSMVRDFVLSYSRKLPFFVFFSCWVIFISFKNK